MNRVLDASTLCVLFQCRNLKYGGQTSSDKSWNTTALKHRASQGASIIGSLFIAYESLNPNSRNRLLYFLDLSISIKADNARPLTTFTNAESAHGELQSYRVSSRPTFTLRLRIPRLIMLGAHFG